MSHQMPPGGFERFYKRHYDFVRSCASYRGVPDPDTGDVAQEVFTIACYKPELAQNLERGERWLAGITRNCARNWTKKTRRRACREAAYIVWPTTKRAESRTTTEQLAQRDMIRRYLSSVSDDELRGWVMVHVHGLTQHAAADVLDRNPNAFRTQLQRTRGKIRKHAEQMDANAPAEQERRLVELIRRTHRTDNKKKHRAFVLFLPLANASMQPTANPVDPSSAAGTTWIPPLRSSGAAGARSRSLLGLRNAIARWSAGLGSAALVLVTLVAAGTEPAPPSAPREAGALTPASPIAVALPTAAPEPHDVGRRSPVDPTPNANSVAAVVDSAIDSDSTAPKQDKVEPTFRRTRPRARPTEQTLIDAMNAAESRGQYARALTLAKQHAGAYPNGQLSMVRAEIHVRANCRLGRFNEAKRHASDYAKRPDTRSTASQALRSPACHNRHRKRAG